MAAAYDAEILFADVQVGRLLEAKADINAEDDKGRTALCAACAYGHVDAARRLLLSSAGRPPAVTT